MSASKPPSGGKPPGQQSPSQGPRGKDAATRDVPGPPGGGERSGESPPAAKSGRVTFDARGNAVWEWSMSTGVFGREVDTRRLKKLEARELQIVEDPRPPARGGAQPAPPGGGSDPYNTAGPASEPKRKESRSRPTDLHRLSEWIKQQKALGRKAGKE